MFCFRATERISNFCSNNGSVLPLNLHIGASVLKHCALSAQKFNETVSTPHDRVFYQMHKTRMNSPIVWQISSKFVCGWNLSKSVLSRYYVNGIVYILSFGHPIANDLLVYIAVSVCSVKPDISLEWVFSNWLKTTCQQQIKLYYRKGTLVYVYIMWIYIKELEHYCMHRSAKFQTPPNAVDLLWSCEGLWSGLSFVFPRSDCHHTI